MEHGRCGRCGERAGVAMEEARDGWARCCFVCRRPASPMWLAVADGRLAAWVCAECARQEHVLRAAQGALGVFFPGGGLAFHRRVPPVEPGPVA